MGERGELFCMVKNLIFDLGNVLVTFDSKKLLGELFAPEKAKALNKLYFESGLWHPYDQGILLRQDLIDQGLAQRPDLKDEIEYFMNHWFEHLKIVEENQECLKKLRDKGYNVYILSNLPQDSYDNLKARGCFKHACGGVYSYQELLNKPDPAIYQCLMNRYDLKPEECFFFDDRQENVQAAVDLGMNGHVLESPYLLKQELEVNGFLDD